MSATGGMARECIKFYSRLSKMIAEKPHQPYSVIAPCIVDQWHCQTIYSRQQQTLLLQVKRYPILFQFEYMSIPAFFLPFFLLEVCDWENILVNLWFLQQEEKHPTGWKKCLKKNKPFLPLKLIISITSGRAFENWESAANNEKWLSFGSELNHFFDVILSKLLFQWGQEEVEFILIFDLKPNEEIQLDLQHFRIFIFS